MTPAEKILSKAIVLSPLSAAEHDAISAGLLDRAFFSARCQSVRHLQRAQKAIADMLASARLPDGSLASRAKAVSEIMRSARAEGIATGAGGITDPSSAERASVIVSTNAGLAAGYASYAAANTLGARAAFPAQELVRVEPREVERDWPARWKAAGGKIYGGRMAALLGDPVWTAISRFGVPYPPFDYNSGMGVVAVDYDEAVSIGLINEGWTPPERSPLQDFNATLEDELEFKGRDDPGWQFLQDAFGDQIKYEQGKVRWQADIVTDMLEGLTQTQSVRLGAATDLARAALPEGIADPFGRNRLTLTKPVLSHAWDKHGPGQTDPRNAALTKQDVALIPHVWRNPDRIVPSPDTPGAFFVEKKMADGGTIRLVVRRHSGSDIALETAYKLKP